MIKEIKVLFVAMVAMMMLTGVASAVAPSIELTDLINSANVDAVEITGSGFTANATLSYDIMDNGGQTVDGTGTVAEDGTISVTADVSILVDGTLTATVFEAGPNMVTDTATKDTVAPTIVINKVTTPTNTTSQTVTGTMEDGATVQVTCSTGTVHSITEASTTWSAYITNMQEGDNIITATATDLAGNTASDTAMIFVDTVPPTIGIDIVDTPTNINYQTVTGTMGDDWVGLGVECSPGTVGDITATNTTWSAYIINMQEGENIIIATAIDWLGNEASDTATIVLDTVAPDAPSITLTDPINIANVATVSITGTGEPDALFLYWIEDGEGSVVEEIRTVAGDGTISVMGINVSCLEDGELLASVLLRDAAGNSDWDNRGFAVATKDTVAPDAPAITLLDPINIANVAAVTITGTGEAGAEVEYLIEDFDGEHSVDGDVFVDVNGNISVTGINVSDLADGTLTASVWLTDAAGNKGNEGIDTATKDTVAPIAAAGQDQIIILGDTVQFNGSDSYDPNAGTIISYSWDFGDDSGISTDAEPSYEYDKYGEYTVTLTVTDAAGNMNTDTMTVTHGIKLNVGWNLISTPLIPDNTSIEVVLSDVDDATIVWEYDADTSSWLSYIPGGPGGALTEIAGGIGYWIDMSDTDTLVIEGSYFEEGPNDMPTYPVYEGWNLIGVHSLDLRLAETYMSSASCDCAHTLHGYQDGAWVNIDLFNGDLVPGYGYWAYMTEDGAIAP